MNYSIAPSQLQLVLYPQPWSMTLHRYFMYLWLFGIELLFLFQFHVQAFIRAVVHFGDGWRGGRAHVAVVPAPVAAAAAVRELAAATLHVSWWWWATWRKVDSQLKNTNCLWHVDPGAFQHKHSKNRTIRFLMFQVPLWLKYTLYIWDCCSSPGPSYRQQQVSHTGAKGVMDSSLPSFLSKLRQLPLCSVPWLFIFCLTVCQKC